MIKIFKSGITKAIFIDLITWIRLILQDKFISN